MKAIIPVAGAGTKLRPHTYTQPKALIPLAGKTILSIIVDQLREAGIKDFIFIIGYLGEKIQDYVKSKYPGLNCHFVQQSERFGIGHAINLTREIVGRDEVLIVLGDTIAEYDVKEVISSPHSMLGVKKVDDPRNFGVAEIEEDGSISRVVEKPAIPKSNMALVGVYKIRETDFLFSCLDKIVAAGAKSYGEFNLTDALECMIQSGAKFQSFKVNNWFDCGRKETLLESNATLLKKFGGNTTEDNPYENTIIIPPVNIGEGCDIRNSVIGPNVAIGEHASLNHAIIKDSIIGAYSNLFEIVLSNSLIGSDAEVKGVNRSLNIGDNTAIDLSGGGKS
ncbi:MAG: NTP transferase domain-containing protein [Ferruginibacter sp.]|nr:NTP transferase domain-containing protein [Ferruginibacter sp.]MBU9935695.1 NTP transferase domain-containing protein [Ferruginibacter sp.]